MIFKNWRLSRLFSPDREQLEPYVPSQWEHILPAFIYDFISQKSVTRGYFYQTYNLGEQCKKKQMFALTVTKVHKSLCAGEILKWHFTVKVIKLRLL